MTRWEYTRTYVERAYNGELLEAATLLGVTGWELVAIVPVGYDSSYFLYFKRPLE